jgi:glucose/arabinose dehydrogenase
MFMSAPTRAALLAGLAVIALAASPLAGCNVRAPDKAAEANALPTADASAYTVTPIAKDLKYPWGLAVLPDGGFLVTEREGDLRRIGADGAATVIGGVPSALRLNQGGLLDVALHPQFAANGLVYLTMAAGTESANHTQLIRGRLEGDQLRDVAVLYRAAPLKNAGSHFGSRLLWLPDGTLLMTLGDGFAYREQAQTLDNDFGKILRLTEAGQPAPGNPFLDQAGARPAIYSYGHRNVQGIARDPASGRIYANEHGPLGGDELNHIEPGKNYGWPAATFGDDYTGAKISPFTERPGMQGPMVHWSPALAPSGLVFYTGAAFPAWQGDLLTSALAGQEVRRVDLDASGAVVGQERLFAELEQRIRAIVQGPQGELYLLTDDPAGQVLRVTQKR